MKEALLGLILGLWFVFFMANKYLEKEIKASNSIKRNKGFKFYKKAKENYSAKLIVYEDGTSEIVVRK